jgi:hypothetical protein
MTGVAGLPVMGPEAGTRLDRPGVPGGARTVPAGARVDPVGLAAPAGAREDHRRRPVGTPDRSSSHQSRPADIGRLGAIVSSESGNADAQRGVHLVAEREAARVGVGLGGVEAVGHVGVADPVFEVDEAE